MKRIILFIFLILVPIAYAPIEYKEIFDQEVKDSDNTTINGMPFTFLILRNQDYYRTRIVFPDGKTSVLSYPGKCIFNDDIDECKCYEGEDQVPCSCDYEGNYYACLYHIRRGGDDEFDIPTQRYPMYAKIQIEMKDEEIATVRTFESTTLEIGQRVKVESILSNTGSIGIPVEYVETYPESIILQDVYNCERDKNKIKWEGILSVEKERKCIYYIKAKQQINFTTEATIFYNDVNHTTSEKIKIEKPQFTYSTTFSDKKLRIGDDSVITINFANEGFDLNDFTYRIYFPDSVEKIHKTGSSSQFMDHYVYKEPLREGENRTITFTIKAKKVGSYNISEEIEYTVNKLHRIITEKHPIEIETAEIRLLIEKEDGYKQGEKANLIVKIINPSNRETYRGIDILIQSDLPFENEKTYLSELQPHETITFSEASFIMPDNNEHIVEVKAIYKTQYNQVLEKKESVKIAPPKVEQEKPQPAKKTDEPSYYSINQSKIKPRKSFMDNVFRMPIVRQATTPVGIAIILALLAIIPLAIILKKRYHQEASEEIVEK
jgi:hypothetical protein